MSDDIPAFLRHPEPSTHIKGDPLGRTYTPEATALAVCLALRQMIGEPRTMLEPCVGGGAFVRAAREAWPRIAIEGIDLDPEARGLREVRAGFAGDATAITQMQWMMLMERHYHLILTNPPFGEAAGDTDVRLYHALRPRTERLALLMPIEHACLHRWADPMSKRSAMIPLVGRVWDVVRGMALYVWGRVYPDDTPALIHHGGRHE